MAALASAISSRLAATRSINTRSQTTSTLAGTNWYRDTDRTSKKLNVGVDFIDTAIALAKDRVPVDARRVFMSGWSNGAAMAMFYALNTDGIAGTSVYSAPDPYRDSQNPCTQVPRPKYATPTQDIHNYCDLFGISTTGKYFYDDCASGVHAYQSPSWLLTR